MNNEKLWNAIGFAMRSGNVVSGDYASERAIKGGKAFVALMDAEASDNTRERYGGYAERAGIPVITIEEMGRAIGKPERMVAAVTDKGFAQMILGANANTDGGVD